MPVAGIRMRGYIRAASAAGFEADVVSVPGPDYTEEAGAAAGRILLGRDELPTAVVTGHDQQAAGVLQVLSRAGVAIPGRVSLTGFGGGWPARLSSVDLTTAPGPGADGHRGRPGRRAPDRPARPCRRPYPWWSPGSSSAAAPAVRRPADARRTADGRRTHWIRGFTAPERTGSGVSWRSSWPGAPGA
jgi:hypothetical protein